MRFVRYVAASGVATGLVLTGGAGAASAADDPPPPQPSTPLACDSDGVRVSDYMIDFAAPGRLRSSGATLTGVDPACAGRTVAVSVGDGDGTPLARGRITVPAGGGTVDISWDPALGRRSVPIAEIEMVEVTLSGTGTDLPDDNDPGDDPDGPDRDRDDMDRDGDDADRDDADRDSADRDNADRDDAGHSDGDDDSAGNLPKSGAAVTALALLGAGLLGGGIALTIRRRGRAQP